MGTPDILGTYGTFSYYTTDPFTWAGQGGVGREGLQRGPQRGRRRGHPLRPHEPLPRRGAEDLGSLHRLRRRRRAGREDRGGERRAGPEGGRVDRLGAGQPRPRSDPERRRHRALLSEGGPARLRPLRHAAEPRPAKPGDADLASRLVRGGAGRRHRPLLHAGHARGHEGLQGGRLHRRGVRGPGAHRRRGGRAPVRVRARPLPGRAALLLLRQRRPGLAHDVAGDGSRRIRPTSPRTPPSPTPSRRSTSSSTGSSARPCPGSRRARRSS